MKFKLTSKGENFRGAHFNFSFVTDNLNLDKDFTKEEKAAIEKYLFDIRRIAITTGAHDSADIGNHVAYIDNAGESTTIFVDTCIFSEDQNS